MIIHLDPIHATHVPHNIHPIVHPIIHHSQTVHIHHNDGTVHEHGLGLNVPSNFSQHNNITCHGDIHGHIDTHGHSETTDIHCGNNSITIEAGAGHSQIWGHESSNSGYIGGTIHF